MLRPRTYANVRYMDTLEDPVDPNIGRAILLNDRAWTILSKAAWPGADYYYLGTPEEGGPIVRSAGLVRNALTYSECDPNSGVLLAAVGRDPS